MGNITMCDIVITITDKGADDMNSLAIGDTISRLPIVQGGMGIGVSMANLATAVANEGGVGVISAAGLGFYYKSTGDFFHDNEEALRHQIRTARSNTTGVLGVNIMVALTNFENLCTVAFEEEIDIIFAGAGLPLQLPRLKPKESKTKLVPIISSARAAKLFIRQWKKKYDYIPDAFVLEGPKAGGHLGFKEEQLEDQNFVLENLLIEVLEAIKPYEEEYQIKIPIIVAGGIYYGNDISKFLSLGASGVQLSTRFVTTKECDASDAFKQTYVDATEEDIVYIKSPVGLPGRAIKNAYLEDVQKGLKHPFSCPYNCIITCQKEEAPYCITLALINAQKGKFSNGFAFAGSNAYLATKINTVKDVFQSLLQEMK